MHSPENVVPLRDALEVIGVKAKSSSSFRRYWLPLGAPIVPASFAGSRERWGADPEALRAFVVDRRARVAEEARVREASSPNLKKGKPEGFTWTMAERMLMVDLGEKCSICEAPVSADKPSWATLRLLDHPTSWSRSGRALDHVVLCCEACTPMVDEVKRTVFDRAVKSWKLENERERAAILDNRGNGGPAMVRAQRREIDRREQPTASALEISGHSIYGYAAARRKPSEDGRGGKVEIGDVAKGAAVVFHRADGFQLNLNKWFAANEEERERTDSNGDRIYPDTVTQQGIRFERTRGRPVVLSSSWGGTYAYDGGATW